MKRTLFRVALLAVVASMVCVPRSVAQEVYPNALKFTFLSWASGSTKISYERALPAHRQSAEICASLIGAGYDKYHNRPLGFTLRYGHKFFLWDYSAERPLDGFYLRPEAMFCRYTYDSATTHTRTLAQMGALLATAGYQHTFGRFLVDGWVGGGYCFGTPADTGYHHGFQVWDWFGTRNDHIALSFSIRLGWCF